MKDFTDEQLLEILRGGVNRGVPTSQYEHALTEWTIRVQTKGTEQQLQQTETLKRIAEALEVTDEKEKKKVLIDILKSVDIDIIVKIISYLVLPKGL